MNTKRVNVNKINVLVLTLLLVINFASIGMTFAENDSAKEPQGEAKIPEVPGLPENAVQYNKTDVAPVAQAEKVQSNEPALFAYQNITMLFNSTMNCDLVITAEATANQKIFALSVDPNQTMTLTMNFSSSPFQNELTREKNLNFYANIEPNATIQLSAQLRLFINQTELDQELNWEVNASKLTWMYWNGTQSEWVKVPSTIDQDGYLVCVTDHFSIWTVGEEDLAVKTQALMDMALIYGALGVGIAVIVAIGLALNSKRR